MVQEDLCRYRALPSARVTCRVVSLSFCLWLSVSVLSLAVCIWLLLPDFLSLSGPLTVYPSLAVSVSVILCLSAALIFDLGCIYTFLAGFAVLVGVTSNWWVLAVLKLRQVERSRSLQPRPLPSPRPLQLQHSLLL